MKQIDFLPERYREQTARKSAATWRVGVLLLFGGCCAAAAFGQYLRQNRKAALQAAFAVRVQAVLRRQQPGEHGGVRGERQRRRGVGPFQQHPLRRQAV